MSMQIGPLVIPHNEQGVMTSRKEMKDGKCLVGVSGMWCLHGATFGTVWERGTEASAREDSRNNGQPGWRPRGLGKAWVSGWKTSCVSSISRISRNV